MNLGHNAEMQINVKHLREREWVGGKKVSKIIYGMRFKCLHTSKWIKTLQMAQTTFG